MTQTTEPTLRANPSALTSAQIATLGAAAVALELNVNQQLAAEVRAIARAVTAEKVCTCPSGDGSLRWPCPKHPPEKPAVPEGWALEVTRTSFTDEGCVCIRDTHSQLGQDFYETGDPLVYRFLSALAALPAEKPAAAAERGANDTMTITLEYDGEPEPSTITVHGTSRDLRRLDARLKFLHKLERATPPAQAAEPEQVDEVERLSAALRNMRTNAAPRALAWTWADCALVVQAADMLERLSALTQRPAAPLATDAGVDEAVRWDHSAWMNEALRLFKAHTDARPGPSSNRAWHELAEHLDNARMYWRAHRHLTAHPAAERPAQREAAENLDALRARFEAIHQCSHGHKRSRRGCYRNPPTARDWKWFRLGAQVAPLQARTEREADRDC